MPGPTQTVFTVLGPLSPFSGSNVSALFEYPSFSTGNYFPNVRGKTHMIILNDNAGSDAVTVTFDLSAAVSDQYGGSLPVTDKSVTIGAGEGKILGPFSANAETSGNVLMSWAGPALATEVRVLVFKTQ